VCRVGGGGVKTVDIVKSNSETYSQVALLHGISSIIYMEWEPGQGSWYSD
jgi:hypothetical protein